MKQKAKTLKEAKSAVTSAKKARLAFTMSGVHGSGKSTPDTPGDKRSLGAKLYQIG